MNSLSLMIYIASIVSNIQGLLIFSAIITGMVIVVSWFGRAVTSDDYHQDTGPCRLFREMTERKSLYAVVVLCSLFATLIPSEKVIYAIAASEAAGTVVASPDGQEVLNDLKTIIKNQLKEATGETKKE